jgi:exodeoxyribonuclease V beta subunit
MTSTLDIRSFPLQGSQLIEASAGTGKTFTIALLYTRLILQHGGETAFNRALNPEEILVVTFTDAATQELKDRIRARLAEAARCFFSPDDVCDPLLNALRSDYPPTRWAACARLLTLAAQSMDQAAVSTIHSWCYRMLREHAFDSGSLFHQNLITNQKDILADLIRDYWRQQFYILPAGSGSAIQNIFADPDALLKAVQPLINKTNTILTFRGHTQNTVKELSDALAPFVQAAGYIESLEQQARDLWAQNQGELEAILDDKRASLHKNSYAESKTDEGFSQLKQSLADWSLGGASPDRMHRFAQGSWKLSGGAVQPEHPALAAIAELVSAQEELKQQTGPDLRAIILSHASNWLEIALQQRLYEKAELGFDDLMLQLDRALQGPQGDKLAAQIRRDFPVALIDEFQDTDPLQYRIFDRIYNVVENRQDCAMIMIGDPKQAIYSFRNADIHTYLAARQATEGRHFNLDRNFRSTHGLVNAINKLFSRADNFERGAFRFRHEDKNPLPFLAVNANGRNETLILNNRETAPLTIWQLPGSDNEQHTVPVTQYRSQMAQICADQIAGLLASGNSRFESAAEKTEDRALRPKDMAVLVRNRTEADLVRAALHRHRLASVYLSDRESVFATPEARDVLRWLQACAEPGNERRVRAALGTRSLRMTLAQLLLLQQDEQVWEIQTELFRDLHKLWQSQGVLPMLRHLMQSHQLPQRLRAEPDGERPLTNLLHLAEYLQKASTQHEGEQALIRHLAEQIEDPGDEEILRLESDNDLIRVVTIHKSKGLEYPLVFLPFIADWKEVDGTVKQVSIPVAAPAGTAAHRRLEIAGRDADKLAWQTADDERLSEDMRLLYVAMTRATHALWLGIAPVCASGKSMGSALHKSAAGYLLGGGQSLSAEQLNHALSALSEACDEISVINTDSLSSVAISTHPGILSDTVSFKPASLSTRSPDEKWWIASYSSLKTGTVNALEPERATDDQIVEEQLDNTARAMDISRKDFNPFAPGLHGFRRGPKPGTFLHNLLEWADETGFSNTIRDDKNRLAVIRQRCELMNWAQDSERLDNWLKTFLQTRFRLSPDTELDLCHVESSQSELEFLFASHIVSSERIDDLCRRYLFKNRPRPVLMPTQLNGMVKGFIDLVFCHQGRYYVADWKSNYLGPHDQSYTLETIRTEVLHNRYDVQYAIYLLALHRLLLSRVPDYDYDRHIGGAVYFFLRGWQAESQGLLVDKPPRKFIEALDGLFSGKSITQPPEQLSLMEPEARS